MRGPLIAAGFIACTASLSAQQRWSNNALFYDTGVTPPVPVYEPLDNIASWFDVEQWSGSGPSASQSAFFSFDSLGEQFGPVSGPNPANQDFPQTVVRFGPLTKSYFTNPAYVPPVTPKPDTVTPGGFGIAKSLTVLDSYAFEFDGFGLNVVNGNAVIGADQAQIDGVIFRNGRLSIPQSPFGGFLFIGGNTNREFLPDPSAGVDAAMRIALEDDAELVVAQTITLWRHGELDIGEGTTASASRVVMNQASEIVLDGEMTAGLLESAGAVLTMGNGTLLGTTFVSDDGLIQTRGAAGTLATIASSNINLSDDNRFRAAPGTTLDVDSVLNGSGNFIVDGTGFVELRATNNWNGSIQINSFGRLTAETAALGGDIVNNGALTLDLDLDETLTGSLGGSGSLTKIGGGTLTMENTSAYTGGTFIGQGTVVANTFNMGGSITNSGMLVLDQDFDGTFNATLTGNGTVVQRGEGVVTFAGTYNLGGNLKSEAIAGGALAIDEGANVSVSGTTQAGTGRIELRGGRLSTSSLDVSNPAGGFAWTGGRLSAQNVVGDLNNQGGDFVVSTLQTQVAGDYAQAEGGTLSIAVSGFETGESGQLDVSGTTSLAGGLVLNPIGVLPDTLYDPIEILSSSSGLVGKFDQITGQAIGNGRALAVTYTSNAVLIQASLEGDANLNGQIEQSDLNAVLTNWGRTDATWITGDLTGDGFVAQADLNAVLNNWGSSVAPDFTGFSVPEPAALGLVGMGLASLSLRRQCV